MKRVFAVAVAVCLMSFAAVSLSTLLAAKSPEPQTKKAAATECYSCPMHPDVKAQKKGKCPKCGMNLEKPPFRHAVVQSKKESKKK